MTSQKAPFQWRNVIKSINFVSLRYVNMEFIYSSFPFTMLQYISSIKSIAFQESEKERHSDYLNQHVSCNICGFYRERFHMASSSVSLSLCRCGWLMTGRVSDKLAASNLPPYHKKLTADSVAERIFLAYFKQALFLSLSLSLLSSQPSPSSRMNISF